MKKLLLVSLFGVLIPYMLSSQTIDTGAVTRQVDSLIQVSRALTGQNQFGQALEVNAVAEQLALEKLGEETASYGTCCFNRGRIYFFKGDYVESEKWYTQAKTIRALVLGTAHEEYGLVLNNIGNIRLQTGNYQEAEALYLEAKAIWEKSVGKMHQYYSWSLNNLANIYRATGQYQKAESIFLEALSIKEKL